ncbi:MAG: rhomboid family intramembrane serine protease [Actinomycetota bacterium]|nr:rhomboid family intramembrane serine protease [Actinomycetota bacterium]
MGRYSFSSPADRYGVKPWFRVGGLDVTTPVFVVALSAMSMLLYAVSRDAWARLVLIPDDVLGGQLWRIVTWPFANDVDIWTVITLAVFWYFGTQIEGLMGRSRFVWFLGLITVIPGLVATFVDLPQAGIRPVEFGVFLVFIAEYPYIRFFFGIPAWILGAVFLGIEVLQLVSDRNSEALVFLFVTLAVAALTARSFGLLETVPWIPKLPLPGTRAKGRSGWSSRGSSRVRGNRPPSRSGRSSAPGDVVKGPWSDRRPDRRLPVPPQDTDPGDEAELDALLDKINAGGIDGLTGAEKRRLNELSKRLRDRR